MRSASARASRLLTRICISLDSALRAKFGLPIPEGREHPYPIDIHVAQLALELLIAGLAAEEVLAHFEREEIEH